MTDMLNPDQFSSGGAAAGTPTAVNSIDSGSQPSAGGSPLTSALQAGGFSSSDVGNIDKMTQAPAPISGGMAQFPGPSGGGPTFSAGVGPAVAGGSAAVGRAGSNAGGAAAAGLGAI